MKSWDEEIRLKFTFHLADLYWFEQFPKCNIKGSRKKYRTLLLLLMYSVSLGHIRYTYYQAVILSLHELDSMYRQEGENNYPSSKECRR